ncbi:MAG: DUF2608 domain-containing protein [Parachlamydia sp.]|nr:DUF2608 domain-containing protein [Parachlamydia sp.]
MKRFLAGLSLLMTPFQSGFCVIAKSDSLTFLEQQIESLGESDLVVFDMDDVLIVSIDAILHLKVEAVRNSLHSRYLGHLPHEQQVLLHSYVWTMAKTTLVEPHVGQLIKMMQNKGIKVIVLTAAPVGSLGVIEDTVALRLHELKQKDIDLSPAFPNISAFALEEYHQGRGAPAFRQGVILSGRFPKGEVLSAFLKKIDWKPRRLIFLDDRLSNVESVESSLSALEIDLQCWHYTASDRHLKEVDHAVADLQIRTLVEKGIWLSDQEAAIIIAENTALSESG